ncbi:MAG: hypothetical protein ACM30G_10875 [Micromonosporaceae bacterium]
MTSGFRGRFDPAQKWETDLIDRLVGWGWLAAPFGQAQVPQDMRPHLARWLDDYGHATLLRWTPDIIAVRPAARPYVCLIDAKTENESNAASPNYSIEINAVDAGLTIVRDWHMPLYYVWEDGGVLTPQTVMNRWNRKMDGAGSGGSNTAYYLVAKRFARKANAVFIPLDREENAA